MVQVDQPGYDKDEVVIIKRRTAFDDLTKRPCFRESILYSFNFGLLGGLAKFMMTSDKKKGLIWAFWSYTVSVAVINTICGIKKVTEKQNVHQLEPIFQSYAEIYGTENDKITRVTKDD